MTALYSESNMEEPQIRIPRGAVKAIRNVSLTGPSEDYLTMYSKKSGKTINVIVNEAIALHKMSFGYDLSNDS